MKIMRRLKANKLVLLVVIMMMLGSLVAYGVDTYQEKVTRIQRDEVFDGDYFGTSSKVYNEGTVTGDMITAAEDLQQLGQVEGDLIAAANNILVAGKVKGNLRLAGQRVEVIGEVNRNATIFAATVMVEEEGVIDGSIHIFAGDLDVKGFVGGDIRGGIGNAVISGTVKGNVNINVGKLYIEPGAIIEGNLTYTSEEEQTIDPTLVKGEIRYQPTTKSDFEEGLDALSSTLNVIFNVIKVIFLVSYLLIGLLLIKFFKRPYQRAVEVIEERPLYGIGLGVTLLISVPIAAFLLLITVVGIPFSVLGMTLYFILIFLAKIPVALWLGGKILRDENRHYIRFIVGSLLIAALGLIPFIGGIASTGVTALGMGATLIMIKRYYEKQYEIGEQKPPVE